MCPIRESPRENDPEVRRRNFEHLQRVAATPELAREFSLNSSMIASIRSGRLA